MSIMAKQMSFPLVRPQDKSAGIKVFASSGVTASSWQSISAHVDTASLWIMTVTSVSSFTRSLALFLGSDQSRFISGTQNPSPS
ncbi:hypothetical protein GDO81_025182 [Engystomops pustulosus]|uniref:Uncharacterized protein n=1 Tax=Engystomops pustulosus TaxID=76066 RepID=A0AAV6YP49_ENGPU|nr:hypothetical protein GDO81_025182 [Engystomops pustulosus]